ncbi:ubiquitin ligase, putative [Trichomonas vaginalis G3]|uniref:HECT-type E3 ubiquitin transferase n=1 Tax=Trichomonas vaginalis (strain ATCC PRA-98 / G3) TaxID=412133 RepID=A2FIB4_TRIV3|nr:ubiquitin-protein transferase protein [Trichomonas vaginalis G3]EAX95355.1 ubiquitin ligase, putative [Trichomonas vaginalis G3]KAI5521008.1 ubiquitin-protein transferase protein [Trichomonas vaginalis G3]|eukprot:XP_001308285.1 ubiquitin ligase [Trichomonas vaginalis G3]
MDVIMLPDPKIVGMYKMQLDEGCDKFECMNFDCKGCIYGLEQDIPNDVKAEQLAARHANEKKLCDGLLPIIRRPEIVLNLTEVNQFLIPLIESDDVVGLNPYQIDQLQKFLGDCDLFPYLCVENPIVYNFKDMQLKDQQLYKLANFISREAGKIAFYQDNFLNMIQCFFQQNCQTRFHVRGLLILFAFSIFFDNRSCATVLSIINHINNLPQNPEREFWHQVEILPLYSTKIVEAVHSAAQNFMKSVRLLSPMTGNIIFPIAKFLTRLFKFRMEDPEKFIVMKSERLLKFLMHEGTYFNLEPLALIHIIFTTPAKQFVFDKNISYYREQSTINRANRVNIDRNNIIQTALSAIERIPPNGFLLPFQVTFQGEDGADWGGLTREFFFKLTEIAFSPDYGMFRYVNSKYYWFVPESKSENSLFRLLGLVIGLGAVNKVPLPVRFPLLMYKKILNKTITLNDLAEIDPHFVTSVSQMREMKEKGENIEDIGLYFTTSYEAYGEMMETPLVPDGDKIPVTNDNFEQFVVMYLDWHTSESFRSKFESLAEGFRAVITPELINIFSPQDLDQIVSGSPQYDWPALKKATRYVGYQMNSRAIKNFWSIFENDFNDDNRRAFLKFVTGADYSPIGGLGTIKLVIEKEKNTNLLPVAHTCMLTLGLPDYPTREKMKQSLFIIIQHTEGFGFK